MLAGLGSLATHVAVNPQVADDSAPLGKDAPPLVVIVPLTGVGLLATLAKQMREEVPCDPFIDNAANVVPVVQSIVVVAVPTAALMFLVADHNL